MNRFFTYWPITGCYGRDRCTAPPSGRRWSRTIGGGRPPPGGQAAQASGETQLEPYLAQFRIAALHYGRGADESATQLALALEGTAVQVLLLDLAPAAQRDLQALTRALERRFGQRAVADHCRELLTAAAARRGNVWGPTQRTFCCTHSVGSPDRKSTRLNSSHRL